MDNIVVERSAFVGLVTSAVEAYNRETNGFLVGNRATRLVRQKPREVTVLRAAYPLQTEDRKPNWVSHGNEKAFKRARGAIENADVGYAVLGGFHSHTGDPPRTAYPTSAYSIRSEEHTSELQSQSNLVCRLLLEKKKKETRRSVS